MDYPEIGAFYDRYLGQLKDDPHPWGVSSFRRKGEESVRGKLNPA